MERKILDFYKIQGIRTKVKKGTFDEFPESIEEICKIIHWLLIHPDAVSLYNLNLSKERMNDRNIKTIQESVDKIRKLENKPLIECREPEKRVVNICKHFAMFLCSVLREKGIPARCRCGFATYFVNGWFEDHWICEYWNKTKKKWIRVCAQIDDIQILECHIDRQKINFDDLPKEAFFSGGVLWKLYRQGLVSGDLCGFSLEENEYGEWYIRGNMLRDFFALNKVEYTYQEVNKLMDRNYKPTEEDLLLLDRIADLTLNIDNRFEEFLEFNKNNKDLIPK